ncbi:MAG: hypothetical protein JWP44_4186 [Mucilaginibacter sp.]|nr:hypothetical protein [Mucilaginibacter sp.]
MREPEMVDVDPFNALLALFAMVFVIAAFAWLDPEDFRALAAYAAEHPPSPLGIG